MAANNDLEAVANCLNSLKWCVELIIVYGGKS